MLSHSLLTIYIVTKLTSYVKFYLKLFYYPNYNYAQMNSPIVVISLNLIKFHLDIASLLAYN